MIDHKILVVCKNQAIAHLVERLIGEDRVVCISYGAISTGQRFSAIIVAVRRLDFESDEEGSFFSQWCREVLPTRLSSKDGLITYL